MSIDLGLIPECSPDALRSDLARALAQALQRGALPYATLTRCRQNGGAAVVELEAEVELVQYPVHDIRPLEPLAALFTVPDNAQKGPEVLALRPDFPADVPHLNLTLFDRPKNLCLYEVPFRDVRAQWTPARFVARIRDWLRLTARGELHAPDQPLEPLLGDAHAWVVLPHELRSEDPTILAGIADAATGAGAAAPIPLDFTGRPDHKGLKVLVAQRPQDRQPEDQGVLASAIIVRTSPRQHMAIRRAPTTLEDLHNLLAEAGDDLLRALRATLRDWERPPALDARFLLVLLVPKLRAAGGPVEDIETWVVLADRPVRQLGVAIGAWDLDDSGNPGRLLSVDQSKTGADVYVSLGYPIYTLSRAAAAQYNGRAAPVDARFVAIGGGAIGSQVILNAVRAAFGRWMVIDDDLFLPHNLARHALPADAIAYPKAVALQAIGNALIPDEPVLEGIAADVLKPGDRGPEIAAALAGADVIVDLSASVTVARALARDIDVPARRVSIFLNPTGTDLSVLAEDTARSIPLDALEMQYYRVLVNDERVRDSLRVPPARIRYGRSCRDVSVELPQALVGLHAGIATRSLEQTLGSGEARLRIWHTDDASLGVTPIDVSPAPVRTCTLGEWTLVTDDALLVRLASLREAKLPKETGGVLLGTFDLVRRIVYVVDTIPSPPDSKEWPTLYIRGCIGLSDQVRQVGAITAEQLHYIGDWHSHPAGCSCRPSGDDMKVFAWLAEVMDEDGLPALMMIAGDGGLAVPYLGTMQWSGEYPATLAPGDSARAAMVDGS